MAHVSLVSREDGKGDIVSAAQSLARRVQLGSLHPHEIDESAVQAALATNRDMPEPELLVRLGPVDSNLGFLPWQVRLTEIHALDTHRGVRFSDYYQVLRKYSKCEQRFGK